VLGVYVRRGVVGIERRGLVVIDVELRVHDDTTSPVRVGVVVVNEDRLTEEGGEAVVAILRGVDREAASEAVWRSKMSWPPASSTEGQPSWFLLTREEIARMRA
jgi:hypothetical protein